MEQLGRVTTMNSRRQITLTKEELDSIGVAPGERVVMWVEDGMEQVVISKPDAEKTPIASGQ